jgi:hypothetical protein
VLTGANGGWASATNGNFRVASGATLGGNGRISGTNSEANSNLVLVQSGGILSPGDSEVSNGIGTLTLDGAGVTGTNSRILNMASGAKFVFDLSGSGGTPDRVDFWNFGTGDFVLNNNVIDFNLVGSIVGGTYTVDVFRFFSGNGTGVTASGISSGLTLGTLAPDIQSATILYGTNSIQIQYTVVPEPGTWAVIALMGGIVLWRIRRRMIA